MLVLSRKMGEGININKDITIEILSVSGDRVQLGINAPREVRIFRKELLDQTIGINQAAVNTPMVKLGLE